MALRLPLAASLAVSAAVARASAINECAADCEVEAMFPMVIFISSLSALLPARSLLHIGYRVDSRILETIRVGISFALAYDPPDGYDYEWSGN